MTLQGNGYSYLSGWKGVLEETVYLLGSAGEKRKFCLESHMDPESGYSASYRPFAGAKRKVV